MQKGQHKMSKLKEPHLFLRNKKGIGGNIQLLGTLTVSNMCDTQSYSCHQDISWDVQVSVFIFQIIRWTRVWPCTRHQPNSVQGFTICEGSGPHVAHWCQAAVRVHLSLHCIHSWVLPPHKQYRSVYKWKLNTEHFHWAHCKTLNSKIVLFLKDWILS